MSKFLFSDFDGVLFDTLKEAYIICRHAYSGTDFLKDIEEYEYKRFYRFKYLVYNSWQYYYLMKLLKEGLSDTELAERYTDLMKNRDLRSEKLFDNKYYKAREVLMQKYHDYWYKLETPFKFFYYVKQGIDNKRFDLIIVSKKNSSAIKYRCSQYGLNLSNDKIFGKDELKEYSTKADFIHEYMRKNHIKKAFFVDDNSNNLNPCNKYPEITPMLAGWGNIKAGELGQSPEEIIKNI